MACTKSLVIYRIEVEWGYDEWYQKNQCAILEGEERGGENRREREEEEEKTGRKRKYDEGPMFKVKVKLTNGAGGRPSSCTTKH